MAPKAKNHARMVAYVPKEFEEQVRLEAKERKLSLGELIQEAFHARVILVRREKK